MKTGRAVHSILVKDAIRRAPHPATRDFLDLAGSYRRKI
jgi:hypothetical protein